MKGADAALSQQQVIRGVCVWGGGMRIFSHNVSAYFSSEVWEESGLITSQGVWWFGGKQHLFLHRMNQPVQKKNKNQKPYFASNDAR